MYLKLQSHCQTDNLNISVNFLILTIYMYMYHSVKLKKHCPDYGKIFWKIYFNVHLSEKHYVNSHDIMHSCGL